MSMCVRCGTFRAKPGPDGWVLCEDCRERAALVEERQERRARIAGRQRQVCEQCGELFVASRLGHRFCMNTCRWKAWVARQQVDV